MMANDRSHVRRNFTIDVVLSQALHGLLNPNKMIPTPMQQIPAFPERFAVFKGGMLLQPES